MIYFFVFILVEKVDFNVILFLKHELVMNNVTEICSISITGIMIVNSTGFEVFRRAMTPQKHIVFFLN